MTLELGTLDVRKVHLMIPALGAWVADVDIDLASDQPVPSGPQTLTVGTTSLTGTVVPEGTGRMGEAVRVRLVAGGGAWSKAVAAYHWHNDAPSGVLSSTVTQATANAVGETANDPSPISYGTDFERVAGPASSVLEGRAWHVDAVGVTQISAWPTIKMGADAFVIEYDPEQRVATMTADEPVWPGTTIGNTDVRFDAVTVCEVDQIFDEGGSRVTAFCASSLADRFGAAFAAIAGLNEPAFERIYWYRISTQGSDGRLRLQAMTKSSGIPDTLPISVWPGIPGASAKYKLGTLCAVYFLNGDRTQPRVFSFDGVAPLELHLDADTLIELGAGATMHVALGELTDANFTALETFASALGTVIASTVLASGITDGQRATFAAALTTFLAAIASTKALKVKAL